jgi:hypothetical protein
MKPLRFFGLVVVFGFLQAGMLSAQSYNESQYWCSFTAEGKLPGPYKAALQLESRTDLSERMWVNVFANLSLQRDWSEAFATEVHYRVMMRNPSTDGEVAQRIMLDVTGRSPVHNYDVALRLRFGQEDEFGSEGLFTSGGSMVVRQKLTVKREFGSTQIFISAEQFESISRDGFYPDQLRLVLGSEFKLAKRHRVSVFLMSQHLASGTTRLNIGTGYIYRLKSLKRTAE